MIRAGPPSEVTRLDQLNRIRNRVMHPVRRSPPTENDFAFLDDFWNFVVSGGWRPGCAFPQGGLISWWWKLDEMTVRVVYRKGSFIPQDKCELQEGAEGLVLVASSAPEPPTIADPAERRRRLAELVEDLKKHPLPADSPKLTRDQMHERDWHEHTALCSW
jgi:hypothetical protein